jgi:type I restriction enzyme S subunit
MVTYPKDWTETKLLDCVRLVQGLTYRPENVKPYGTLVLRSSNIQGNRLSLADNVYVDINIPQEKMIQAGDILVCVRNGSSSLIGKSCKLRALPHTTFGAFMSVLRGDTTGYFAKLVESDIVQGQVKDRSSATINQITKKDFESILVTIPDSPEQAEIAETLSCIDTHIANITELIEKKRAIRNGALEDLVSGGTRLKDVNIVWEKTELGQIASYRKGRTASAKKQYISTENMRQEFAGITPYSGSYTVDGCEFYKGDILMANIRPYLKKIWYADFSGSCSADVLVVHCNEGIVSKYLYCLVANDRFINYIMNGGTKGIKMPRGDKEFIMHYPVLIPTDVKIQQTISDMLTSMDEEIIALEEAKDKILQIKAGAMDDLLTGRIRLTRQGE